MKKVIAVLTLALITVFSTAALAQNEDQAPNRQAWQAHREAAAAIQDKMWAKSMEYEALIANPNSKQSDITAVINEMSALRGQMRAERDKFAGQMGDDFGPRRGFGKGGGMGYGFGGGMGYGHGGFGDGRGYGRHHRGGGHCGW